MISRREKKWKVGNRAQRIFLNDNKIDLYNNNTKKSEKCRLIAQRKAGNKNKL